MALAPLPPAIYLGAVALLLILAAWTCGVAERRLPHDDRAIVMDEVVGYLVTMFAAPAGWVWVIAGFALFRVFDIWKPFPIRRIDRGMSGGLGTVLDDVVAGLYAWALLQAGALVIGASTVVP